MDSKREIPPDLGDKWDGPAQDALNRMRRAALRGTGCHLTAAMIASLDLTAVGQIWAQPDPRKEPRQ